jgi:hypothetical protein
MKKYVLALFAIVLAVGLNSFTTVTSAKHKTESTTYYWFDYSGTQITGFDQTLQDDEHNLAMEGNCNDGPSIDCKRAYLLSQLSSTSPNTVDPNQVNSPQDRITKTP